MKNTGISQRKGPYVTLHSCSVPFTSLSLEGEHKANQPQCWGIQAVSVKAEGIVRMGCGVWAFLWGVLAGLMSAKSFLCPQLGPINFIYIYMLPWVRQKPAALLECSQLWGGTLLLASSTLQWLRTGGNCIGVLLKWMGCICCVILSK